jgi:zinc/manganese transport system substrate-binding protein
LRIFASHLAILGLALLITTESVTAAETLNVVASFSILGDMTQRIGGDRVQVHTLVGPDADAHVFQPTPADAKTLARAKLVIVNGFGFEGWITRLVKSSGSRATVLTASTGIRTLKSEDSHEEHGGGIDPHAWQDLANALVYVDNIALALGNADPEGKAGYLKNAENYKQEIAQLDGDIRKMLAAIAVDKRKVITSHDAFGYFSRAYGVKFIAPLGINTEAEASAADIGRIIQKIRLEKIPAVFMENISDPRLLERIRQESGARIGGTLFSDALSKADGPAPTYLGMMRYNAKTLAAALSD